MLTDARDGAKGRACDQHVAHMHGISGQYVCASGVLKARAQTVYMQGMIAELALVSTLLR